MKMTKKDALNAAIATMSTTEGNEEAIGILTKMVTQLSKERKAMSDEAKAAISEKRKAETAEKRAKVVAAVSPVLRKYLDTPRTAKELFEAAKDELPEDYTWNKVQAMSDEAKAAISEKRKAETAEKRAKVVAAVSPVLRKYLDTPRTAKELFEVAKDELPEDYTWNKVQAMLIREMKPELEITQKKGSADHYVLKG